MSRFRDFLLASSAAVVSCHSEDVSPTESSLCTNFKGWIASTVSSYSLAFLTTITDWVRTFCIARAWRLLLTKEVNGVTRHALLRAVSASARSRFAVTERIAFFLSPLPLGEGVQRTGEGLKLKSAFTLAEVLITLGIIGVVAAMTLPSLIAEKQSVELQTGLKEGYSLLQQGLARMSLEKGYTVRTENGNYLESRFVTDFKKYFEKIYDCDAETNKPNPAICISRNDGSGTGSIDNSYKNFSKTTKIATHLLDDGQFVMVNKMLVMVEQFSGSGLFLSIDVNGKNKKPNVWGRDLFTFQLMDDGKLLPMGMEGTKYESSSYCSVSSTNNTNGIGCTYRALTDKSFWDEYR